MSAHTPGPWEAKGIHVRMSDGFSFEQQTPIGEGACCQIKQRNQERREANAHLIAAAPDLLEALNRFDVEGLELEGDEEVDITMTAEDLRILRAAIAKAKGGKP